jgi:hypothetical protein
MNPAMEIGGTPLHALFILAPPDLVHSRRSLFLQQLEAVQQQLFVDVMQKRREPYSLVSLCGCPHTM